MVVAGGGYGKTTALRELATAERAHWLALTSGDREVDVLFAHVREAIGGPSRGLSVAAPAIGASDRQLLAEGYAAAVCANLDAEEEPLLLVLDDIDQVAESDPAAAFVNALCLRAPTQLHVVLGGRRLPALRLGAASGQGEVLELAASDLAFTRDEAGALLSSRLDPAAEVLAEECLNLTGGWAAALQLIADRLERVQPSDRRQTVGRMQGHRGWREFASDLIEREPVAAQAILTATAVIGDVDAELLGGLGFDAAGEQLDDLQRRGLVVVTGERGARTLSPVLAEVAGEHLSLGDAQDMRRRATRWLEQAGRLDEALSCALRGPRNDAIAFLRRSGRRLIAGGFGSRVAEALPELPTAGDADLNTIRAEALVAAGDWDRAVEIFSEVHRGAEGGRLEAATAWRFGALLYLRGETEAARQMLTMALREDALTSDDALVSAWLSAALWARAEIHEGGRIATVALHQATASGDAAARAAAHTAMAMSASNSGNRELIERHNRLALSSARAAGDSVQLARVHVNVSSKALEDGNYARAISEADHALSASAGHNLFAAVAMSNKAQALMHTGAFEEARAVLVRAIEMLSDLGSLLAATPHILLGALDTERGDFVRARMSLERALRLAERGGDVHDVVLAQCELVRILAQDTPDAARGLASQAAERATSLERAPALCASSWVELCAGDHLTAARIAAEAIVEARRTDDRPSLARALELEGAASQPADERKLEAAAALWREIGDPVATARAELALAGLRDQTPRVAVLRDELSRRGVLPELGVAGLLLAARERRPELAVTTLGRFSVARSGQAIPLATWGSRKARDLLKLVASKAGHSITRDAAAEALWPNEDRRVLPNRLSVALSTLRKGLDPERLHPPDYFIAADNRSITLQTEHVALDLSHFLEAAQDAAALVARGEPSAAEAALRLAESMYTGDFLEEDVYEDWTVDSREQARAAAQEVFRMLARAVTARGDEEDATRHLRRLLERDPYDADAWVALIGAQLRLRRYGEARRQHALYSRRMAEIDVPPLPLAEAIDARP